MHFVVADARSAAKEDSPAERVDESTGCLGARTISQSRGGRRIDDSASREPVRSVRSVRSRQVGVGSVVGASGGSSFGWSGGESGAVGEVDGELSVGGEGDVPSLVVDLGVMLDAHVEEVGQVGASAVAPPVDVVDLAVLEPRPAAGQGTRRVLGT
jgi:hypothetical protein